MLRRTFVGAAGLALLMCATSALGAGEKKPFEFYGLDIDTATRAELRQAIEAAGVEVNYLNDDTWVDLYKPGAVFEGADSLMVVYAESIQKMAAAMYSFPPQNGKDQFRKIFTLVGKKYGEPIRGTRSSDRATWKPRPDIEIHLSTDEKEVTLTITHKGHILRLADANNRRLEEQVEKMAVPKGAF